MTVDSDRAVLVSIIMPVLDEGRFIGAALDSLLDDYVLKNAEIIVLDGGSGDNTVEIIKKSIAGGLPLRLMENKRKLQCFALNDGILAAQGKYIVRVDGHSIYPSAYVRRLVELLETTGADNVGGAMEPMGEKPFQKALSLAMSHPVGVGDARFHLGNYRGFVDTVYLGAFRRSIFDALGLFDVNCRTNEDAELNIRILKHGGKIFLDSSIRVKYRPRETPRLLARQYFHYGGGRAYTTWKHRRITSIRQLAAPALILGLIFSLVLAVAVHPFFLSFWAIYAFVTGSAALFNPRGKNATGWSSVSFAVRLRIWCAFVIMHISWGIGFLRFFLTLGINFRRKH